MSPAELYEVLYAAQDIVNQLLQFIISVSFAVVVVTYAAQERLNGFLYLVIGVVYTVTYAVLVLRMGMHIDKSYELRQRLAEHGEHFTDIDTVLTIAGNMVGMLIYLGTVGFLVYGFWKTRPST